MEERKFVDLQKFCDTAAVLEGIAESFSKKGLPIPRVLIEDLGDCIFDRDLIIQSLAFQILNAPCDCEISDIADGVVNSMRSFGAVDDGLIASFLKTCGIPVRTSDLTLPNN